MGDKKLEFLGRLKVVRQGNLPREVEKNEMTEEETKQYMEKLRKTRTEILAHVKSIESARFLGKYSKYIEEELREEIGRLNGTTMMIHAERTLGPASTRGTHIYNAAEIAYQIATGIFDDEEVARGIALAALLHDIGQPAFGHDGENMATRASNKGQGGPHPHNAIGATRIIFRDSRKILKAINKGIEQEEIIKEAEKRGISPEELKERLERGEESEIVEAIRNQKMHLKNQKKAAVRTLAMATGRHNGERGTATIIPNYEISFQEFYTVLERCYVYNGEDKKLQSANMVDAIVKISDQLSSIPYDMIDGKKGGVVFDIPEEFSTSVSGILGISIEEAKKRLQGDNRQLNLLVREIQKKLIGSLINNSTKKAIDMDQEIAQYLYGDMRKRVYSNYLDYTTSVEEEEILEIAWTNASDVLSKVILDERGIFPPELNAVFRMSLDDPRRQTYVEGLFEQSGLKENSSLGEFYRYILETSPEEYLSIKAELHKYGINLLRDNIVSAKKKVESNTAKFVNDSDNIEQGMINYFYSSIDGIPEPEDGERYTDEEVTEIYQMINSDRRAKGKPALLLQRDKRLALQLSIRYLEARFNDKSFIDFCMDIGVMSEEEAKEARRKYNPALNQRYTSKSAAKSAKDYKAAEAEMGIMEQEEI